MHMTGCSIPNSSRILPRDLDQENALESRLSCGSSSSSSTLHITRPDLFEHETAAWNDRITKAPLMRRAWVRQERMSPSRIIRYTSAQLFWECEHCVLSEDNAVVYPWGLTADAMPRLLVISFYQSKLTEEWNTEPMKDSGLHPLNQWYCAFIGERYSRCNLTFQQDKLIAVFGLAKLIHDKTSIPYVPGHWFPNEHWFLNSLCWQRDSAGVKTRRCRAPSWSWASRD